MGFGEDVGVNAEGEAGDLAAGFGADGEEVEFGFGFDVEEEDAGVEGGVDLPELLAYSGEDYFFEGWLVGFTDALEFAAGDDVEACSRSGQEAEDGQGGVGFDGVADGVRASGKGLLEELEALGDLRGGVDVERGAVFGGQGGEVDSVTVEFAVAIGERARIDGEWWRFSFANLDALCRKGVGFFGDDDPEDEIRHGADAGEQGHERCDDADEVEVPTIVESKAGADSRDHAVMARARELAPVRIVAGWRRRSGGDSGSAGGAEAGGWVDLFAAL